MSNKNPSACIFLSVLLVIFINSPGKAEIPEHINYQGRLTDDIGTSVPDDTYNITFTIHEDAVADTPLWKEEQSVLVINGIFNTKLPENTVTSPFPKEMFKAGRYLSIKIGKDSEMTPRQPLTSTPFTFWAQNSDMLNGKTVPDLDDRYVNIGQQDTITSSMIADGSITSQDLEEQYFKSSGGVLSGELTVGGDLSIGTTTDDDDEHIWMDSGEECLRWDDDPGRFFLSDDLYVRNTLQVGWTSTLVDYNRIGTGGSNHGGTIDSVDDLLINGALEVNDDIYADGGQLYLGTTNGSNDDTIYMDEGYEFFRWDESTTNDGPDFNDGAFYLTDDLALLGDLSVGTLSGQDDDTINFDGGFSDEFLKWDESENTFVLSDDFEINGNLTLSGDILYSSPKTHSLNIPAEAFVNHFYIIADDYSTVMSWKFLSNFAYLHSSHGYIYLELDAYAPVYLPESAEVTGVTFYFADLEEDGEILSIDGELWYRRPSDLYPNVMASVSGTTTGLPIVGMQSMTDETIDNAVTSEHYTYTLKIHMKTDNHGINIRFYGCSIAYTLGEQTP